MKKILVFITLIWLSGSSNLKSQVPMFSIALDQDKLIIPGNLNEDRNYTQGTSFTLTDPIIIMNPLCIPLRPLHRLYQTSYAGNNFNQNTSLSIATTAFTPLNIGDTAIQYGDRPYSSLFYLSESSTFELQKTDRYNNTRVVYDSWRLNVGMLGTNVAKEFQSSIHKALMNINQREVPLGWHNQISQGGKPTFLLEYSRMRPFFRINEEESNCSWFDGSFTLGGSIGYYERIYAGPMIRFGRINRQNIAYWQGNTSTLNSANQFHGSAIQNNNSCNPELFVFLKTNATLMLRNSLLQGQRLYSSVYTLDADSTKSTLLELEYGIGFYRGRNINGQPRFWSLLFKQSLRSPEFDTGNPLYPKRWHAFGSLVVTFSVR